MDIVKEDGIEYLWMADNETGAVVKSTLDGEVVMSIEKPDLEYTAAVNILRLERQFTKKTMEVMETYG